MKKITLLATITLFILGFVACGGGGGKYAEAKEVMEEYANLFEGFANDLDKSGSAQDVANALNSFADGMEKLVPKMKSVEEKYPELKESKDEEMPAELKPIMDRMQNEIMPKFTGAMMKVAQYANDPVVQEANMRFQKIMMDMGK